MFGRIKAEIRRWINRLPWRRKPSKPTPPPVDDIKPPEPPQDAPGPWMEYDGRTVSLNPAWGFVRTYVVKHSPLPMGSPRYTVAQGYHSLLKEYRPAQYDIPMQWHGEGIVQVVGEIPGEPDHVCWLIYPNLVPLRSDTGPQQWRAGFSDYYLLAKGRDG